MRYFAYGSNMHRARLEARIGRVVDHGRIELPEYRHAFAKRGNDGSAKGTIVEAVTERVFGVMYEIDGRQLEVLTGYEGGYRRIEVAVAGRAAVTFEALRIVGGLSPNDDYVEHYIAGMREHGFPPEYIELIVKQSAA